MSIPFAPFCALTLMLHLNPRPQFSALSNEGTTRNPPRGQEAAKRQVHARLGQGGGLGMSVDPWMRKMLETVLERR